MVGTSLSWLLLNFLGGFINSAIRDPIPCRRGCFRRRFLCGFEKMDAQPAEVAEGVTKCVLSTEDAGRTTLCKRKLMRLIGPLPLATRCAGACTMPWQTECVGSV
eukprot:scaffold4433_cov122-Cylindrotheca_fusiformis.AAC.3